MSGINKVNVGNLDFKRISNNANSASNDDFLNESIIQKEYWGDENGEVDFVLRDDGTYTIEQDGVVMGFTDEQGYQNALKMNDDANVNDSIKNHSDKYYELHDPEQRLNRKNTSEETDTNLNDSIKSHSDKYYELHDPEQRLNRNKVVDGEGVAEVKPIKKMEPSYIGNATENILRNDRAKQWGLGQEIEFEYNGHKAHGHKYLDSSSTIYYVENGIKYWNRYDSKGNLTDVRMDDGKNQTIIYYENDAIVQKKIVPISNKDLNQTENQKKIDSSGILTETLKGIDHRRKIDGDIKESHIKNVEDSSEVSAVVSDSVGSIDYNVERYADSTVWYTIIPKGNMPKLAVANDNYDYPSSELPSEIAKRKNAKIAINFGLSQGPAGSDPSGIIYADGKMFGQDNRCDQTLYMDRDGNLNCFSNENGAAQEIEALDPVWASKGFYAIAKDGEYVDENMIDTNLSIDKHPRTFIGQDYDGNYIIGVCGGRSENEAGMTLREVYDFVKEKDPNLRFLFNGDGGGSSAFIYDGEKLNPNTDGSERPRPDLIYW